MLYLYFQLSSIYKYLVSMSNYHTNLFEEANEFILPQT